MKQQCATTCLGEEGHPGPCLNREPWTLEEAAAVCFPPGLGGFIAGAPDPEMLAAMYDTTDPLDVPLSKPATDADWTTKDRAIEWVLANFTNGMLAKLYKVMYDARGIRREACDEIIKKEKP